MPWATLDVMASQHTLSHMLPASLIILTSVVLRILGDIARLRELVWPYRLMGWMMASTATWLIVAVFGAWAPIWLAFAISTLGFLMESIVPTRLIRVGNDVLLLSACALLSVPPIGLLNAGLAFAVLVIAAAFTTRLVASLDSNVLHKAAHAALVLPLILAGPALWSTSQLSPVNAWFISTPLAILNLSVTTAPTGERVELHSGAIAWIDKPTAARPTIGALLLHGNHRDGSNQPASIALRRALNSAGYTVISIDHPGFGETPAPCVDDPIEAWDSMPSALDAITILDNDPYITHIVVVGHSMGCTDAIRLLSHGSPVDSVILLGAGLRPPSQSDRQLQRAFTRERALTQQLPLDQMRAVYDMFYDSRSFIQQIPRHDTPIIFATFGVEHDIIIASRDEMYTMLPAPKTRWHFEHVTHYASASARYGIVIGDCRATLRIADRFKALSLALSQ